jgi:polyvinyl alcohol dehydrogenase (cytochrome)
MRCSARYLSSILIGAGLLTCAACATARAESGDDERGFGLREEARSWKLAGHDLHDTRSTVADPRLNRDTVSQLALKWVFTTAGDVTATPTVEGHALYVPDWGGMIYKIDTRTGKAVWSHKVSDFTGNPASVSRTSPAIAGRLIVFGDQASPEVIAIDRETGKLVWRVLADPQPVTGEFITASPTIFGDRIYVGVASHQEGLVKSANLRPTFRGRVVALDLHTGAILWTFITIPEGYTGGSVWGGNLVVDEKRHSLFFGTANNITVPPDVTTCLLEATSMQQQSACLDPNDHIDSIVALDLQSGTLKWARRMTAFDTWNGFCFNSNDTPGCPIPSGQDSDFGAAPNLFTVDVEGDGHGDHRRDIIGAGEKSGIYWALDPDNGSLVWARQVGPGANVGGILFGTASDGERVYVPISNNKHFTYEQFPNGPLLDGGSWAALDAGTGAFVWQVPVLGVDPQNPTKTALGIGAPSVANGVVFLGSEAAAGDMAALDARTGEILWRFQSGGAVAGGPAIVGTAVYWGSGSFRHGIGSSNNKLYAFELPFHEE